MQPVNKTEKLGIKYKAAGGQTLTNQGEKNVTFRAGNIAASMQFQAINELSKPLASAARITAQDNTIVMRGAKKESYIPNDETGIKIPLHIENGVYVMDVDVLLEESADSTFGRQALVLPLHGAEVLML